MEMVKLSARCLFSFSGMILQYQHFVEVKRYKGFCGRTDTHTLMFVLEYPKESSFYEHMFSPGNSCLASGIRGIKHLMF